MPTAGAAGNTGPPRGIDPRGSPTAVWAYLIERAEQGASAGTVDGVCSTISYLHRSHGLDDPVLTEAVGQARHGLRRTLGTASQRLARPLRTDDIRQLVNRIDRSTPTGARNADLILLGFVAGLPRAELTGPAFADVETKPDGLLLHVRRSKTHPGGHGQVVGVARGQQASTNPVAALAAWIGVRGCAPGPMFVSLRNKTLTDEPISGWP